MDFAYRWGKGAGFFTAYVALTLGLYVAPSAAYYIRRFISELLKKPFVLQYPAWSILQAVGVTMALTVIGLLIQRYTK